MSKTGPSVDRANSKQDYATPRAFLDAVEREFGTIVFDLAASEENRVCECFFGEAVDSLKQTWVHLIHSQEWKRAELPLMWLNPPYTAIPRWAAKCAEESLRGARIAFLVPASVGANWYWDHIAPYARVYSVGRIMFVTRDGGIEKPACYDSKGKPTQYPKDLILAVYDRNVQPAFERWQWKPAKRVRAA